MRALRNKRIRVALLALVVAMAGLPGPARAQDERADLKLELETKEIKPGERELKFKITNVSEWWADETTLKVKTTAPTAGNSKDLFVENLDPGQATTVTYTLAAGCNDHEVEAELVPAKNYAGVPEGNKNNNWLKWRVCPKAAQPAPAAKLAPSMKPVPESGPLGNPPADCDPKIHIRCGFRPATDDVTAPLQDIEVVRKSIEERAARAAHAQPGTHTLALDLARSSPKEVVKTVVDFCSPPQPGRPPVAPPQLQGFLIGWWQTEYDGYACTAHTHEVALLFDSGMLDQVPLKTIHRAVLTYDEAESFCVALALPDGGTGPWVSCWTNGEGEPEPKPQGCVVVAVPTVDWRNGHHGELPNTTTNPDVKRLGPREWDVTQPVIWQHTPNPVPLQTRGETAVPPGFGFLLRGGLSISQLEAQDNTRCTSDVSNIRLHVTYTVPAEENDEPFRAPK